MSLLKKKSNLKRLIFAAFSAAMSVQRRTLSLRLPRPAAHKRFKRPNRKTPGRQTACLWTGKASGRQNVDSRW
ncbi:hypothetical protein HMPREF1986_01726 [Oribacterium sp. oral taxon 078 str. F0263]|nr:hypothetical protein HMPREF1986_01726 [Oribacterium sp. oral taxon 078 str. F0263]